MGKYNGIACEENYHDAWIKGVSKECETLDFLYSGFRVIMRDESRSIEDTFALVEKELGLQKCL